MSDHQPPQLEFQILQNAVLRRDRNDLRPVSVRVHRVVASILGRRSPELEEVTQHALYDVLKGFRTLPPDLAPTHNVAPWINAVARNAVFKHLRSEKRYWRIFVDDENEVEGEHRDPYDPSNLDDFANAKLLLEALDSLDPIYRVPLVLSRFEGHSNKDIARELDIQEGTVKSRINRAERLLREYVAAGESTYSKFGRATPNVIRKRAGS